MYTTLPTFAHVGEQKIANNDEEADRNLFAKNNATRRMTTSRSPQTNNKLIKITSKYKNEMFSFTNKAISDIGAAISITNRVRNTNHRKHRARIKQHMKDFVYNLYIRKKSTQARNPERTETIPRVPQNHNLHFQSHLIHIANHQQISTTVEMPSKKAKKSRKDARARRKKKEKEAKQPVVSPPQQTLKSCLKQTKKGKSKRKKQPIPIDDSDDSDDDSKDDESSDSDVDSPEEEEPTECPRPLERENVCYYKVKLFSDGGNNPNKIFQLLFRKWFTVMKRGVPSFIVYSYRDLTNSDAIQDKTEITAKVQDFRKYFIGIKLKSTPGDVWFRIRCGFDDSPEDMKDATDWWFRENNGIFFKQPLQVPDTARDIWLFMSHDRIDTAQLTEAIQEKAKSKSHPTAPFVLMYSAIRDGRKFNSTPRKHEKPIKALHVECAVSDFLIIRELFSYLYGQSATTYPLDMWMRYVLVPNQNQTTATREGILALRRRQADFPLSIDHSHLSAITTLDREVGKHEKTFREMIMQIKTKDDQTRNLFLGINANKMAGGHTFTFALDVEQEARDMAVQFGSYLAHKYCDKIFKCMEATAAKEARNAPWDPATHSAKSPEDESMKNLVEIVDGMGWLKKPEPNKLQATAASPSKTVGFQFPTDTSSIKTFASKEKRKRDVLNNNDDDDESDDEDDESESESNSDDDDDESDDDADSNVNVNNESGNNGTNSPDTNDNANNNANINVTSDHNVNDQSSPSVMEMSSIESTSNTQNSAMDVDNSDLPGPRNDERTDRILRSSVRTPPPAQAEGQT